MRFTVLNTSTNTERILCQFSSVAQSCPTLYDPMNRSTPGLPVHHQLLEFTQTHMHWVGAAIQPSHPLSSPSPPAPNESTLRMRWPKYWNFSLSISPSNECSGLISFRIDWFDILYISPKNLVHQLSSLLDYQFREDRAFRLFYSLLSFQEREQCPVCVGAYFIYVE